MKIQQMSLEKVYLLIEITVFILMVYLKTRKSWSDWKRMHSYLAIYYCFMLVQIKSIWKVLDKLSMIKSYRSGLLIDPRAPYICTTLASSNNADRGFWKSVFSLKTSGVTVWPWVNLLNEEENQIYRLVFHEYFLQHGTFQEFDWGLKNWTFYIILIC